jgi:hypothetical protein
MPFVLICYRELYGCYLHAYVIVEADIPSFRLDLLITYYCRSQHKLSDEVSDVQNCILSGRIYCLSVIVDADINYPMNRALYKIASVRIYCLSVIVDADINYMMKRALYR